ncbi:MAG: VanZ family protein [Anaerolineales bacterium]|uniref:VanZ family protein n=1 Tax=Candidatus Desulfolinea nitratireducens TaxID=2841698 RepID=A0A8J6TGW0_9CHLR|nr:VanZ family protein [Candidatus Desulfolinea nitratireducens]MBL6959895.1 VanZ family protein [Anaerolineales bacterium]
MRKNWPTFLTVIMALLIVILANGGNLPRSITRIYDFPYGDKAGHFLIMGLLCFFLNRTALASFPGSRPATLIWRVSLILAFVVTLEELSQQYIPRRTFSLIDLAFSYAGIAFFGWLVARKNRPAKTPR